VWPFRAMWSFAPCGWLGPLGRLFGCPNEKGWPYKEVPNFYLCFATLAQLSLHSMLRKLALSIVSLRSLIAMIVVALLTPCHFVPLRLVSLRSTTLLVALTCSYILRSLCSLHRAAHSNIVWSCCALLSYRCTHTTCSLHYIVSTLAALDIQ
jgi:hypothetical protein